MTTGRTCSTLAVVVMLVALPAPAGAQQRGRGFERLQTPAAIGVHGFSIVLVVGGMQGTSAADNVPEAARKALADMKDFLPYKRYQLLDAAWILCCSPLTTQVSGRVRGPDGRDYVYTLDPNEVVGAKLNLRFTMRDAQQALMPAMSQSGLSDTARLEHSRQLYEAIKERDDAELVARTTKQKFDVGITNGPDLEAAQTRLRRAEQRLADLQMLAAGGKGRGSAATSSAAASGARAGARGGGGSSATGRSLMDSSFSIALGETVVIGTSRLNGDQALIAILTAAAKPGASR